MERTLGAEAPGTPPPVKAWDKQISEASTAAPPPDFARLTSQVSDHQGDVIAQDLVVARGGPRGNAFPLLILDDGFDFFEAPCVAAATLQPRAGQPDAREARGGLAAKPYWQPAQAPAPADPARLLLSEDELDFFDAACHPGGCAGDASPLFILDDGFDFFEAPSGGGVAAATLQPRAGQPGAHEARRGFAAKPCWQRGQAPVPAEPARLLLSEDEFDFFEVACRPGGCAGGPDAYEARGGMAEALSWQLPAARPPVAATAEARFAGHEVDFYEARGGMADMLRLRACCA